MKTIRRTVMIPAIATAFVLSVMAQGDSPPQTSPPAAAKESVNYVIRVEWKEAKGASNYLQVLTSEGNFNLNTVLPERVKIDNMQVPATVSLKGELRVLSAEKGQLSLFLGHTIPYVTSTYGAGKTQSSSYQQLSVGLNSTFVIRFGKPLLVQSDGREDVTILVKREETSP